MGEFIEILQQQGLLGLFIFGIGFSVVTFAIGLFFLKKAKVINFKSGSNGKTEKVKCEECIANFKDFTRGQFAETRKVVYEMKQQQEIHAAVLDNTLKHFEKGIDKMVNVLSDIKVEIKKAVKKSRRP